MFNIDVNIEVPSVRGLADRYFAVTYAAELSLRIHGDRSAAAQVAVERSRVLFRLSLAVNMRFTLLFV